MKRYHVGHVLDNAITQPRQLGLSQRERFTLTDEELGTGTLCLGTTGSGKSRWLRQLIREHWRNGRGLCAVEPGDLIEDFLAECAHEIMTTGNRSILKKLHVVELNPFQLVRYDPFQFVYPKPIHPEMRDTVYRSYQNTKVQSVAEIYQWKQGQSTDFAGMPTLQRNFINVFTALTTLVKGKRLSAADADILVDLQHPDHDRVYARVELHLPREIVADFEVLHSYKNVRDVRNDTGSFINRIRAMHGPLVKEMVATDGRLPTLILYDAIQKGHFILVKTGKTPFASNDQNNALASLFIHDVIDTMLVTPRELRKPFTLMIDEAHKYVRPGIGDIARIARKYQLALVIATTDAASLKHKDVDLAVELLNVVNIVIAFRMTWPEDLTTLAEYLFAQNIDFTELMHEVERRDGLEWLHVDEWSESTSRQSGLSNMNGSNSSATNSHQDGHGFGASSNQTTRFDPLGRRLGIAQGTGRSTNHNVSDGKSQSEGTSSAVTKTESESFGYTINHKLVHIEKIVRELQKTGKLERSVADQVARFAQQISGQAQRRAIVRVRERKAVQIEALEVRDPFRSPEAQARAVEWIRRELYRTHEYYFTPSLDPADQQRRIDEFVNDDVTNATASSSHVNRTEGNPLL